MLSEQIKALRTARNISQVELAKKLHVTKQSVSNWENDNILPSIEMLIKLAEFFSVSTDYMLGREERKCLDVSLLTESQVAHIQMIIDDLTELTK